ncbi:MAG: 2-phosphosulfolactate phosphatase [Ignavibacteriales bacterium]|nr:2-phosphosulfolactate phosphatase [Ignavibacteriales bacterium]
MKIEVFYSLSQIDDLFLRDKNVVVIDVLRASTTVIAALNSGAREIIPVNTIESAVKVSGNLFGDVVIRGGERNAKMIEGFNLGNSPFEYTPETVKGKSIIFYTTNGAPAMWKARYAKNLLIAGFVNITAVVNKIKEIKEDVYILCAGKQTQFCIEDAVCAGMLTKLLIDDEETEIEFNDSAVAAVALFKNYSKNLLKMTRTCDHGKYLIEIGFEKDIEFCTTIDTFNVVPELSANVLKLKKKVETPSAPHVPISIDTAGVKGE